MQWVLLAVLALVAVGGVVLYNRLIAARNQVRNLWRQIDVQLKRRYDLIPNLVSAVKDVMSFEKETLENVTNARSRALSASSPSEKIAADQEVSRALASLYAVVEQYPDLKSNQNVQQFQAELTNTENQIAGARSVYNTAVRDYQNMRESVPSNFVASAFQFAAEPYFEATEEDKAVPKVSLR